MGRSFLGKCSEIKCDTDALFGKLTFNHIMEQCSLYPKVRLFLYIAPLDGE